MWLIYAYDWIYYDGIGLLSTSLRTSFRRITVLFEFWFYNFVVLDTKVLWQDKIVVKLLVEKPSDNIWNSCLIQMPQKLKIFRFTKLNRKVTCLFYLPLVLLMTSVTWDWSSVTSSDGDIPYNQEFTNFSTPQNILWPRDLILGHEKNHKNMFNSIVNYYN